MLSSYHNQTKYNRAFGKLAVVLILFLIITTDAFAQRYLADFDSTLFIKDTLRPLAKRFNNISFSGYIQPQFQIIETKGAASYAGGNFQEQADNRFMLPECYRKVFELLMKVGLHY